MIICPACNSEIEDDARFCSRCGERMSGTEVTSIMAAVDDQTLTNELSGDEITALEDLPIGSALLVVMKGPASGARFLLRDDRTVAGRHPGSGIFFDDVTVSRSHVAFVRQQEAFIIEDLGSLNGTYVNRHLIKSPTPLRNGDEVQIGKYKMVFFLGSAGSE